MKLVALQIKTTSNFQENLTHLKDLINLCEKDSLILAPKPLQRHLQKPFYHP